MKTKRKVPFEALPMHQSERLSEVVRQQYEHDFDGLVIAYLRTWSADELRETLDAIDAADDPTPQAFGGHHD